ncbi:flagellar basal body-associated FliL family protein [Bythopirellula polymerisocia]|uniref:Flagellar protein FliL n=1 Tax=Bythopirellula polymerisocia TaxID=2528003 RepID=A0A5C6D3S6_9BACT|nr:flagellar basal body-associated FliL family protein [Bythopirellula polymerisocia]TWU30317.1 hypothetical protein Pla144_11030 [Bythopirellula polymerisocia]
MSNPTSRNPECFRKSGFTAAVVLMCLLFAGCGGRKKTQLDVYLDELEVERTLESVQEVPVGTYGIASAIPLHGTSREEDNTLWIHLRFQLVVICDPSDEKAVLAAAKRHRGMLDDTIITVCRKATKEELEDNRWATLKSRIIDAIRPILGDDRVRQLAFVDFSWEAI